MAGCSVHESTRSGGPHPAERHRRRRGITGRHARDRRGAVVGRGRRATGRHIAGNHPGPPQTTATDPLAHARQVLANATPPDGFAEGVLGVTGPAGTQLWPVIVADTPQARQRGLMGVDDFSTLGGYAAMVFVFDGDTSGAFWMRDTPLPLRITFVAASGSVVSAADMAPCLPPTPPDECERYRPEGPYRIAIEHPVGPAFDIGLAAAELVEVTVERAPRRLST